MSISTKHMLSAKIESLFTNSRISSPPIDMIHLGRSAERKDKSVAEKEQKGEEVSGKNKEESCGTTLNKQVTLVAKSGQDKESHKDVSALASKCEQVNILYEIYIFSILF